MINSMIESIQISLNTEFGSGYEVYREETEQGLQRPCFFIRCAGTEEKQFLNRRYFRMNQFCVRYVPTDGEKEREACYEAAERLFQCLKWLEVGGDLLMGTKMRYEVADGVLQFFVNYDMFVYKRSGSVPLMEDVSSSTSVKGEITG